MPLSFPGAGILPKSSGGRPLLRQQKTGRGPAADQGSAPQSLQMSGLAKTQSCDFCGGLVISQSFDAGAADEAGNDARFLQIDDRYRAVAMIGDESGAAVRRESESHGGFADL